MAVELQIESSPRSGITSRALQKLLNTTCFHEFGEASIDHATVVFGPCPGKTIVAGGSV